MQESHAEASSKRALWILLAIGAAMLILLLGCAGLIWMAIIFAQKLGAGIAEGIPKAIEESLKPLTVAVEFQKAVLSDDLPAAYEMTTTGYRKKTDLEGFKEFVKKHPVLTQGWTTFVAKDTAIDHYLIKFIKENEDGTEQSFDVRMRKEKGEWKIDDIVLP